MMFMVPNVAEERKNNEAKLAPYRYGFAYPAGLSDLVCT
jgi:hypothetical protein